MRSIGHLLLLSALAGVVIYGLAACEEPAYQQAPAPQQTTAQEPETPVRTGTAGAGTAYGGAMRAAERTADRVEDQQRRIEDELPDY